MIELNRCIAARVGQILEIASEFLGKKVLPAALPPDIGDSFVGDILAHRSECLVDSDLLMALCNRFGITFDADDGDGQNLEDVFNRFSQPIVTDDGVYLEG